MSLSRFVSDLQDYYAELEQRYDEAEGDHWGFTVRHSEVEQFLDDIIDYVSISGDDNLFAKLTDLKREKKEASLHSFDSYTYTQAQARVLRIIRLVETFGNEYLPQPQQKKETPSQEPVRQPVKVAEEKDLSNRVFVVHGHGKAELYRVKETLTVLGLKPVVLHEQPSGGKTIIEKLVEYSDVGFAVVIMTADDMGGSLEEVEHGDLAPRARQNVVMELGFFTGKLSRSRVCVLKDADVRPPSDILGVVYTTIDENGAWRLNLAQELANAGYDIDLNKLIGR